MVLRVFMVLGVFSAAPSARADVVSMPPTDCPAGTLPATSHAGPHCSFAPPCSAADCGAGTTCTEVGFCVRDVPCGGLRAPDDRPCTEQHVGAACGALGHCADGETCVRHAACTATAAPPPASTPASTTTTAPAPSTAEPSGCSAGGAANGAWAWIAAPIALLLVRRRSRA